MPRKVIDDRGASVTEDTVSIEDEFSDAFESAEERLDADQIVNRGGWC